MCIVTCRTLREPAAGSVQRGRGPRAHRDGSVYGPCSGGSHSVVPAPKPAQVQGSATRAPSVHREEERADVPLRGEAREGACPSAGRRPGLAHTAHNGESLPLRPSVRIWEMVIASARSLACCPEDKSPVEGNTGEPTICVQEGGFDFTCYTDVLLLTSGGAARPHLLAFTKKGHFMVLQCE